MSLKGKTKHLKNHLTFLRRATKKEFGGFSFFFKKRKPNCQLMFLRCATKIFCSRIFAHLIRCTYFVYGLWIQRNYGSGGKAYIYMISSEQLHSPLLGYIFEAFFIYRYEIFLFFKLDIEAHGDRYADTKSSIYLFDPSGLPSICFLRWVWVFDRINIMFLKETLRNLWFYVVRVLAYHFWG